jgi:hypothetical protein
MHAVGEGAGGGAEVGQVNRELVGGGGVGYEDAIGTNGFEESKFIETDCFMVCYCELVASVSWSGGITCERRIGIGHIGERDLASDLDRVGFTILEGSGHGLDDGGV